jgi:hypothetical protein
MKTTTKNWSGAFGTKAMLLMGMAALALTFITTLALAGCGNLAGGDDDDDIIAELYSVRMTSSGDFTVGNIATATATYHETGGNILYSPEVPVEDYTGFTFQWGTYQGGTYDGGNYIGSVITPITGATEQTYTITVNENSSNICVTVSAGSSKYKGTATVNARGQYLLDTTP